MDQKKILVVDDEKPLAHALELKFSHEGYLVKAVYDGENALAELKKNIYDLALLDIVMPRMDGFSVLSTISQLQLKTKVIVLSNLSQDEEFTKAKKLGAIDFLVKSNTPLTVISEKVNKLLSS